MDGKGGSGRGKKREGREGEGMEEEGEGKGLHPPYKNSGFATIWFRQLHHGYLTMQNGHHMSQVLLTLCSPVNCPTRGRSGQAFVSHTHVASCRVRTTVTPFLPDHQYTLLTSCSVY